MPSTRIASPGARLRPTVWGSVAIGAGTAGIVASLEVLPPALQGPLVAAFIFLGPGAVLRNWVVLPPSLTWVVIPAVGLSVVVLLSTLMVSVGAWHPMLSLVVLSALCVAAGLTRWRETFRRGGVAEASEATP
jgi:uncharacterized membrane protein